MPSAPRPKGKAKKIAWAVLGVPPNIAYKPKGKQKELEYRVMKQDTNRAQSGY